VLTWARSARTVEGFLVAAVTVGANRREFPGGGDRCQRVLARGPVADAVAAGASRQEVSFSPSPEIS